MIDFRVVIGLGNCGQKFFFHRHNIGFRVIDALAKKYEATWQEKELMHVALIECGGREVFLIKPQTYMNNSGEIVPWLKRKGIEPEQVVVVHDELEKSFGTVQTRLGGSHRGHNGLRSIIEQWGQNFWRVRMGIERPREKDEVSVYVLSPFSQSSQEVDILISNGVRAVEELLACT